MFLRARHSILSPRPLLVTVRFSLFGRLFTLAFNNVARRTGDGASRRGQGAVAQRGQQRAALSRVGASSTPQVVTIGDSYHPNLDGTIGWSYSIQQLDI